MKTHTLGPWHVGMRPGPMIYGPNGEQIADMRRPAMVDDKEHDANVRLIAAAPDMLAALESLRAACARFEDDPALDRAKAKADKALTKAKGTK